jgi:PAS domain S-box-containing protein
VSELPLERLKQLSRAESETEGSLAGRVLDKMPDPLIVVDADGTIRMCNEQAELFFGWTRQAMIGQKVEMLLPEDARERHVGHRNAFSIDPRVRPMGTREMTLSAQHRNGRLITDLQINLAPVVADSGLYTAAVIRRARP